METDQRFHPEMISRQGERNAWILTGFALTVELVMFWRTSTLSGWMSLLVLILLVSASLISLSNWVDRKTALILGMNGITFRNGLRNVLLSWDQVEKVHVTRDRWGQRVHVLGAEASFNFRMLSDVEFQGKVRGQMGFPNGEIILKKIIDGSGLSLTENRDRGRYYARP